MPISTAPEAPTALVLAAGGAPADPSVLGGKGAQTLRLLDLGLPVPPTGVVTVDAYRQAVADPAVLAVVSRIRGGEPITAGEVDAAFLAAAVPDAVLDEIASMGRAVAGEGRVAVRSSATVEDLAGTSFAGQYRSILDVVPGDDVERAVRLVWASLWHPAPCAYRRATGVDDAGAAMAVVVMAMVPAVEAGVVFTVDPSEPGRLRIESVDGLAESLVSGARTPRSASLDRKDARSAPPPLGAAAGLALDAEDGFGVPLDVEWAWDGARVWLVQARPITVAPDGGDGFDTRVDDHALTTAGIAEMLPGVLPPLVWQLAGTAVEEAIRSSFDALGVLDARLVEPHALVRRVRGRAALDLDALKAVAASLPGGSAEAVEHGFFGGGADPRSTGRPAGHLRTARHDLRVEAARRHALHEAKIVVAAAERIAAERTALDGLADDALLGRRRRLLDLGLRAMAAELGVAAAATAAYDRLESFLAAHLTVDDAAAWTRRLTTGATIVLTPSAASMSVFAGPTWEEAGVPPPVRVPPDGARAAAALAELQGVLQSLPRWRATRIMTGQVVDVRVHLLRRLVGDTSMLLAWRERAKGAVLTIGGLVRAGNLAVAARLVAAGALPSAADVDLLSDAELRGATTVPPRAVLARRRRAVERMAAAGSLPERFTGVAAEDLPPVPAGDRLHGLPASGGRVTARARVVRDPLRAKLRTGEILVAESTDAGWSPLFLEAGGIVVERGGPLSHAAIVARELGVPAVLDVRGATRVLDGRTVTVDGDAGIVVVHDHGSRP